MISPSLKLFGLAYLLWTIPGTTFPASCPWKLFLTLLWSNPDWILWSNPLLERSALHGLWDAAKTAKKVICSHFASLTRLRVTSTFYSHANMKWLIIIPARVYIRLYLPSYNIQILLNLLYTIPYWKFNVPPKFLNLHYYYMFTINIGIRWWFLCNRRQ
jgi:hypothetical protein